MSVNQIDQHPMIDELSFLPPDDDDDERHNIETVVYKTPGYERYSEYSMAHPSEFAVGQLKLTWVAGS